MGYIDPYDEYLQQLAVNGSAPTDPSGATAAGQGASSTGSQLSNSGLQGAGMALDAVGSTLSAYGQAEAASQARSDEMRRDSRMMKRQYGQDEISEEERRRNALQDSAGYADRTLEELLKNYGSYNERIGR